LDGAGVEQWALDGRIVCALGSGFLEMVGDGAAGVILTWRELRAGISSMFGQRISSSGDIQWDPGGIAITHRKPAATIHAVLSDSAGGIFVSWSEEVSEDLYVQRLDSLGAALFTPGGLELSTAAGFQGWPTLISDGSTGLIAAWLDSRRANSYSNHYTQHLSANGVP
jgi:hypothetical protein